MSVPHQNIANPLYAVIDLGSNSFHMLITRLVADGVQTVDKVKRKVRLASGLNDDNVLSEQAISRGLECLSFFAERLQDISPENIRIVATATLRIAVNSNDFITRAEKILGHPIRLLSGVQEAECIYLGVAHTSDSSGKRLVLDIGGASTELVIGDDFAIAQAQSLNIGCVTFNNQFFSDGYLNTHNFEQSINHAKSVISPLVESYKAFGWQDVLGGSGTMQALAEILMFQNKPAIISLSFLQDVKKQLLSCKTISNIKIDGLQSDRAPVIASGLSILIALYESLSISEMHLSSGAIREGILYEMLPNMRDIYIRKRTVNSLSQRFHIDNEHAKRVKHQAMYLFEQFSEVWQINHINLQSLLKTACRLHEIGLLLSYKHHQQHGAYIIKHTDFPGYNQAERKLIEVLVAQYKGDIDEQELKSISTVSFEDVCHLLIIMRLAVILCRRRRDDVLPDYKTHVEGKKVYLCLPEKWLDTHPLLADELLQEHEQLSKINYHLLISC